VKLLRKNTDQNLILNTDQSFKTDLGWTENAEVLEKEILYQIINPSDNYETVRYSHKPYINTNGFEQLDIWFYFYFGDYSYQIISPVESIITGVSYQQDYRLVDITVQENTTLLKQSSESFFRLEFYKTANDESPNNLNRRLVFSKNLPLPIGEKIFYTGTTIEGTPSFNENIFVPVFVGSNFKNRENMYLFWFSDDSPFNETNLTGNTFYVTAKFYNSKTGNIIDFTNKQKTPNGVIIEENDLYYKMIIDRTNFSYEIFEFNGSLWSRIGLSDNPIKFYERFL
jgi:hypothetical protein